MDDRVRAGGEEREDGQGGGEIGGNLTVAVAARPSRGACEAMAACASVTSDGCSTSEARSGSFSESSQPLTR